MVVAKNGSKSKKLIKTNVCNDFENYVKEQCEKTTFNGIEVKSSINNKKLIK